MQTDPSVAIVVMPFFAATRASLGAGLLKACAERAGVPTDIQYLNLLFAETIDFDLYSWIAEMAPPAALVGDWIFTRSAHASHRKYLDESAVRYVKDILFGQYALEFEAELILRLLKVRDSTDEFLDKCVEKIRWQDYSVVGFTTTFNQNCASIALAQRLKIKWPNIKIIFGGANCEGEMGVALINSYECIDAVCSGEGEDAFLDFAQSVIEKRQLRSAGNLLIRGSTDSVKKSDPIILDSLPYPDLSDYYQQLAPASFAGSFKPLVPIETSRGCWWGEKHHCTFCGLNGSSMKFRSKSQNRAFDEIKFLSERWGNQILCVDNILDLEYIKDFLPRLAESALGLDLHYEVKVNLTKLQLKTMHKAGIAALQPGIESFLTPVLKLMEKGTTKLQNVQFMRWCKEIGINVAWNILYGFPGEQSSSYSEMIDLLPLLAHLDPPQHCGKVRADRHSPYHSNPNTFAAEIHIQPSYSCVYPFHADIVNKIAYYFDLSFSGSEKIQDYENNLQNAVNVWIDRSYNDAQLRVKPCREGYQLYDTRFKGAHQDVLLTSQEAEIFRQCDRIAGVSKLAGLPIWEGKPEGEKTLLLIQSMLERRWLVEERQSFLALPLLHDLITADDILVHDIRVIPIYYL